MFTTEGYYHRENQLRFEALKGVNIEDEVKHKGEKGTIKNML